MHMESLEASAQTILLIDDEQEIAALLETVLRKEGFSRIYTAYNGRNGIELCRKIHPDLIILDVMMPDMDGFEVCRHLRNMTLAFGDIEIDEDWIVVRIADNGNGIAEEEMEHLFTRYYRGTNTNEQHQGSGLGMAIARQIMEAHQGVLEVKSQLGHGTMVSVRFPVFRRESECEA